MVRRALAAPRVQWGCAGAMWPSPSEHPKSVGGAAAVSLVRFECALGSHAFEMTLRPPESSGARKAATRRCERKPMYDL